ncbi:MAG: SHOCT domain-containing protein [Desulfatitalea sp.]
MRCRWVFNLLAIFSCLTIFATMGCSGYMPKTKPVNESAAVIYQITEQEALDLSFWSMQEALPGQKIYQLGKPRVGLFVHEELRPGDIRYARFKETDYIYEVDILRVEGTSPQGDRISGYTYAVRGQGDLKEGPNNLTNVEKKIKETFGQTNRAVTVTSVSEPEAGPPKITSPLPVPKEAVQAPAPKALDASIVEKEPAATGDVFEKLEKLKKLFDQGIITEEEFEAKKKELLERI